MVYPTLLPLMRTPRLPVVDWTDAPRRFKWTRPFRRKTKIWFLRVCHHISNAVYLIFNNNKIGDKQSSPYLKSTTKWFCFEHISMQWPFFHVSSTMAHKPSLNQLYIYRLTLPKCATNGTAVSWLEVGVLRNWTLFIPFNDAACSTLTH